MSVLFTRRGTPPTIVRIISFNLETYSSYECQAEEGMTWGEWIDSNYNTIDVYLNDDGQVMHQTHYYITNESDTSTVLTANDIIEEDASYVGMA